MLSFAWQNLLKTPLLNLLIFFTRLLGGNLGLGILAFTAFLQILLTPLRLPQLRSAQKMKELQPKLDELKQRHKDDQAKHLQAQMQLFREHGVSPLGGVLPSLISIVVLIALYRVLLDTLGVGQASDLNSRLYFSFLQFGTGASLSTTFLWLDLAKPDPYLVLPVAVGFSQWFLMRRGQGVKQSSSGEETQPADQKSVSDAGQIGADLQRQMQFILPVMTALITLRLPAGVALYWTLSVVFGILQQNWTHKPFEPHKE